jgi:hypothetical protein
MTCRCLHSQVTPHWIEGRSNLGDTRRAIGTLAVLQCSMFEKILEKDANRGFGPGKNWVSSPSRKPLRIR